MRIARKHLPGLGGALQTCPCALKPIGAVFFRRQLVSSVGHSLGARRKKNEERCIADQTWSGFVTVLKTKFLAASVIEVLALSYLEIKFKMIVYGDTRTAPKVIKPTKRKENE